MPLRSGGLTPSEGDSTPKSGISTPTSTVRKRKIPPRPKGNNGKPTTTLTPGITPLQFINVQEVRSRKTSSSNAATANLTERNTTEPVHSTPATSPNVNACATPMVNNKTLEKEIMDYNITPISLSAGTQLVSRTSALPRIFEGSSLDTLNEYLAVLEEQVNQFTNYKIGSTEFKNKNIHYKILMKHLDDIVEIAANRRENKLCERCGELEIKLGQAKPALNSANNSCVINNSASNMIAGNSLNVPQPVDSIINQSSFHGFPAAEQTQRPAGPIQSTMIADPSDKVNTLEGHPRIPLERVESELRDKLPESTNDTQSRDFILALVNRISALENKPDINTVGNTGEDNLWLRKQLGLLSDKVATLESVSENVNKQAAKILALDERITLIETNGEIMSNRLNHVEHNIRVMRNIVEEKTHIYTQQQQKNSENINAINSEIELLRESASLARTAVRQITSFRMTVNNEIENLQVSIDNLAVNSRSQLPTAVIGDNNNPSDKSVNDWLRTQNTQPRGEPHGHHESRKVNNLISSPEVTRAQQESARGCQASRDEPHRQHESRRVNDIIPSPVGTGTQQESARGCQTDANESCNDSVHSSTHSNLDTLGRLIKRQAKNLKGLLAPDPCETIDKPTLQDIYQVKLPSINAEKRELQKVLRDYLKYNYANPRLCDNVEDILEDAEQWVNKMRDLYLKNGQNKKSQTGKLYNSLEKFSPNSEIDVFEFVRRFECITADFEIPNERAELLYTKYLPSNIQEELIKQRKDYSAMKKRLMDRYGDFRTMINNVLLPLNKDGTPTSTESIPAKLTYFRKFQGALQKINQLLESTDIDSAQLELYVYGHDFMKRLLHLIPEWCVDTYISSMQALNQSIAHVSGKIAFSTLVSSVEWLYQKYDDLARTEDCLSSKDVIKHSKREKPKLDKQANHFGMQIPVDSSSIGSDYETDSEYDDPEYAIYQNYRARDDKKRIKKASKDQFPCIISGHKHALHECVEFYLRTPKERVENRKSFMYRHCTLCLQSSEECRYMNCANEKDIPKVLVCKDCKDRSKAQGKACYSVFFCITENHKKPSSSELVQGLEQYIPGFKRSLLNAPINLACHFQVLSASKQGSKPETRSRPVNHNEQPPFFNTSTGTEEEINSSDVVHEVHEDSIAVMQVLCLKGKPVLTLYDRGANQHLISGSLAEEIGIKVANPEANAIGVVSGGKIWTEYGTYQMFLGPTPEGKYYELVAQGLKDITGTYPRYSLTEINKEAIQFSSLQSGTIMPPYVGGEKVGLLIGLKNSDLEPVCIMNLPSGIGLYKSAFKDIFGSMYCYGGPHKAFSDINHRFHGNINHVTAYFTEMMNQYRYSPYSQLLSALKPDIIDTGHSMCHYKEPCLPYNYELSSGNSVYPTPLNATDFKELGQEVEDEREIDILDCPGPHCECVNATNVFKAKVPLSRQRSYIDEDDKDCTINFRCDKCMRCKCASSSKGKMMSLSEAMEQEAIEKSVTVDLDAKRVFVDLPFTKPPAEFLSKRHGGDNNYDQALKVYNSQTRLPDDKKVGLRNVINELVEKQFLKKLVDLPVEHQALVNNSTFKHYMPWRTFLKPDSESTPVRPVVDPSMTGLNLILAKGENKLKRINDILVRARTKPHIWSSDISKLYNRLHLKPSSYCYQLFLYKSSLNPDDLPEIYVMVVAWYGVSPSSNQALFAIEELARLFKTDCPDAYIILTELTYVDDIMGGADSIDERERQISQVEHVLSSGGFSLKYIVRSGEDNGDKNCVKILGYKFNLKDDTISPGFSEINFSKKKRGMKAPNPFPVTRPDDVSKLLMTSDITRRMVVSKVAELWEPLGFWEPFKFQLKCAGQVLNGLNWDIPLAVDLQDYWTKRFQEFLSVPNLVQDRYIFPLDVQTSEGIRLLCISDAAGTAGGAAIYAGVKLSNGQYSCKLLTSKSRLMSESVPRNELEGIRIAANLAYDVKCALGDIVSEVQFFTDSSIAMSWCHNDKKKLRMFVYNRVCEIRRLINIVADTTAELPLFHIDGKVNPADLLTKPNNLKPDDLHKDSIWVSGYPWMQFHIDEIPKTSFSDLQLSSSQDQSLQQECFPEILLPSQINHVSEVVEGQNEFQHCTGCTFTAGVIDQQICYGSSGKIEHCLNCSCAKVSVLSFRAGNGSQALLNIISTGYTRGLRILSHVYDYVWSLRHEVHLKKKISYMSACRKCIAIKSSNGIYAEYTKELRNEALNYHLRLETNRLDETVSKDKLAKFVKKDDIYYMHGRIPMETKVVTAGLDYTVFFDNTDIRGILPVVSANSDIFYALLMHIHHHVRIHAGVEATLREVMKSVFVLDNPKRVVQAVRKNCPRCRIIIRKTLELEMGNHPQSRLQIAPAFYHCMADICYGFKGKPHKYASHIKTRQHNNTALKIYALVIVCLLSGATSILALEGIETQDVIAALERHSARHGIPSLIFVDQGTQLLALQNAEATLRDASHILKESVGLEIVPSTAKSHCERGRVERKIKSLREMLQKTAVSTNISLTALQWETVFSKMASQIDDIPMARVDKTNNDDPGWELLTPNRFKLGRCNSRSIEGTIALDPKTGPTDLLKRIQEIQNYWYELLLDRLHHLVPRPAKWMKNDPILLNDIVIFRFLDNQNSKLETWKVGKVSAIESGGRRIVVSYPQLSPDGVEVSMRAVIRSPRDLCVISSASEIPLNSNEFFSRVKEVK